MSRNREHGAAPLLQAGARPVSQPPTPCSINVDDLRILARAGRNSDWKSLRRARPQRPLAERAGMVGAASSASRVSRRARKRAVFSRMARRPAWYSAMAFWPSRSCASFFLKLASATSCACLAFIFKAAAPLDSASGPGERAGGSAIKDNAPQPTWFRTAAEDLHRRWPPARDCGEVLPCKSHPDTIPTMIDIWPDNRAVSPLLYARRTIGPSQTSRDCTSRRGVCGPCILVHLHRRKDIS